MANSTTNTSTQQTREFTESVVEEAALAWLQSFSYRLAYGPDIASDGIASERSSYSDSEEFAFYEALAESPISRIANLN